MWTSLRLLSKALPYYAALLVGCIKHCTSSVCLSVRASFQCLWFCWNGEAI